MVEKALKVDANPKPQDAAPVVKFARIKVLAHQVKHFFKKG